MGFRLVVPPVTSCRDGKAEWRQDILVEFAVGDKELFASVFGASKEIATMRAELIALAINKGMPNHED